MWNVRIGTSKYHSPEVFFGYFEKEKNCLHVTKNVILWYLYQTEVVIKVKSSIQATREVFLK